MDVDKLRLIFGMDDFLRAVKAVIPGKQITYRDGNQKVRHTGKAEQLARD